MGFVLIRWHKFTAFLKKGPSSHKHLHKCHIWYPKMKQQCLHESIKAIVFSYSSVCQLSAGAHNVTHDKVVTSKKVKLFFPPIFLNRREGISQPQEQICLRSTHGCKQPMPFPRQAVWSRKTQWHCHTLHTACCFWGTESHNPWETMVGRK